MIQPPKIQHRPAQILIDGQPVSTEDQPCEKVFDVSRGGYVARNQQDIAAYLGSIARHLGAAADSALSQDGCEDLPPKLREGILGMAHAYSALSATIALLAQIPAGQRRGIGPELATLMQGVATAECDFIAAFNDTRLHWAARYLEEDAAADQPAHRKTKS